MAVESQFLFVYNKMKSQVLALWLLVSTTIADDLIEEQVKEAEVVKEDKGGVDKRAERLMDRLEALKEVEQALQVVDKESSGADFVQVKKVVRIVVSCAVFCHGQVTGIFYPFVFNLVK